MKKYLLLVAFVCISFSSFAQSSGDYRSAATGDWNASASWQMFNGTTWVAALAAPSSGGGAITVVSPHTITANSNITADQVLISTGATLNISSSTFSLEDGTGTDLVVNGIFIMNGTLSGPGSALINGTLNWTGTLNSATTISPTGIINLNNYSGGRLLGGTLTLNGTMNITGGGISNFGGTLINNGTINKSV
ncbi:MAG: hypothetical protein H7258_00615, partial [Ferruginibacter sp.]|nr:hypothetical protein [Ferruginibacter sp.]